MTTQTENKLVYFLGNTMYINVTNLCSNRCVFCIRGVSDTVAGTNLWLDGENVTAEQIIEQLDKNEPQKRDEIVFCGYGEPLIKIDIIKTVASHIKEKYPNVPVRVNTNGHANLIHKRNVVSELIGLIDRVSISLNGENADKYDEISQCKFDKNIAYEEVKNFISECAKNGIATTATVVSGYKHYNVDLSACKEIAESLGAKFKIREWLEEGYQ
ncbi:MAG: TatD family nuclease-associated radical SAM protein [bacterium]